jgi:hypothetical protein
MTSVARLSVLALAILLAGCGNAPLNQLARGGATTIYVVSEDPGGNPIQEFSTTATGTVSPTATLLLPSDFQASAVAFDSSGQIYVSGGSFSYQILVYPAGSTGSATPTRTITENYGPPTDIAVSSSGTLYVICNSPGAIAVYPSTANGFATPTALIQGPATQLSNPNTIAVDPSGNIYVPNYTREGILVFAAGATGDVDPIRTITTSTGNFWGLALDASGDLYATKGQGDLNSEVDSIVEFAPGADGAATPIKTITSSALTYSRGLSRDSAGNLYVQVSTRTGLSPNLFFVDSILGFGPNASGSVTPGIDLTSTDWGFGEEFFFGGSGFAVN